jgi:hypothetical protein
MKFRFLGFVSLLLLHSAWAEEKSPGWLSDPQHPSLQYRFVCIKGSQRVMWRNGYPGAVTLKARMKSFEYDGMEDVQIEPGATANSDLDTLNCGNFNVTVTRFSMAPPPPPPPPVAAKAVSAAAPPPPPPAPILVAFEPQTEPIPEITREALASIAIGMNQAEVRQKLGDPLSKLSIPDDKGLFETYRYNVTGDRQGVVRFANGIVTGIISPK